ncbi:hypothetical protein JST56_07270 [Candidatus Dependentiae bacterium]|nr:hypothetical protein [Candidatus Dependentiae bacterium]
MLVQDDPIYAHESPVSWNTTEIKIERKITEFGLVRVYTLPAEFGLSMGQILRCLVIDKGYEAYAKLVILKRKSYTQGFQLFAEAEVDFTKYMDSREGKWTVTVNLMDNGIAEFLKSIESTIYEIPLTDNDAIVVNMDGTELQNKATWGVTNGTDPSNNPCLGHVLDTTLIIVESLNQLDVRSQGWFKYSNPTTQVFGQGKHIYQASTDRQVTVDFDFGLQISDGSAGTADFSTTGVKVYLAKRTAAGVNSTVHEFINETNNVTYFGTHFHVSGSFNFTPGVGDLFYLVANVYDLGGSGVPSINVVNWNYDANSSITFEYFDRVPANDTNCLRFFHVLKKVIEKASNGKYTLQSNILTAAGATQQDYNININNIPWHTVLTSGDALRGLDNPVMKVSYAMLRDFVLNTWSCGVQADGNMLRVEKLKTIFNKDNIAVTVEDVTNFKLYAAADLLVSTVTIGWEPQTYDLLNGKDEFNTSQQYKLPVRRPTNELKLVNSIRADMYGVEYMRYNRYLKPTTDSKFDNNIFALEIDPFKTNGKYNLLRRQGIKQGLISADTAYNFGLSPKSCMIRNLAYIYSLLPNTVDGTITFQTTDKNYEVKTAFFGPIVDEDANIPVASFPNRPSLPLFKPWYIEFDCQPPTTLITAIMANPYSVVKVKYKGVYYKGFIVSAGIKPAQNDIYQFKLLLTPDTDLSTLKNI